MRNAFETERRFEIDRSLLKFESRQTSRGSKRANVAECLLQAFQCTTFMYSCRYLPAVGRIVGQPFLASDGDACSVGLLSKADLLVRVFGRVPGHFGFSRVTVSAGRSVKSAIVYVHVHFHCNRTVQDNACKTCTYSRTREEKRDRVPLLPRNRDARVRWGTFQPAGA